MLVTRDDSEGQHVARIKNYETFFMFTYTCMYMGGYVCARALACVCV